MQARGQLDEAEASWLPWAEAFVQMSQAAAPADVGTAVEEYPDQGGKNCGLELADI